MTITTESDSPTAQACLLCGLPLPNDGPGSGNNPEPLAPADQAFACDDCDRRWVLLARAFTHNATNPAQAAALASSILRHATAAEGFIAARPWLRAKMQEATAGHAEPTTPLRWSPAINGTAIGTTVTVDTTGGPIELVPIWDDETGTRVSLGDFELIIDDIAAIRRAAAAIIAATPTTYR